MSSLHLVAAQSSGLVSVEFQRRIIHNMAEALLRQPSPPCLLRAPTGSGKTFMLAGVLAKVSAAQPTVWLWFVPFVNLTQQTEGSLLANAPGLTPVMLARGRNQEPVAGTVLLSTAQAVARAKDRKAGYARRVLPDGEWGALELVGRIGAVDLEDGGIQGHAFRINTLGLNWWATRRIKIGVHWTDTRLSLPGADSSTRALQTRLQWVY